MKKIAMVMAVVLAGSLVAMAEDKPATPPADCKPKKECKCVKFEAADTDKDGKLSKAEFTAMCSCKDAAKVDKMFTGADTDKDGFLTPAELKAAKACGKKGKGKKGGTMADKPAAPAAE